MWSEQIGLFDGFRLRIGAFAEKTLDEGAELAGFEDVFELFLVRLAALHRIEVQFDRYVGDDGGKKFRVANVFHVVAHFLSQRTFELFDVLDELFDILKFGQELDGRFRSDTGATRDVVGGIAHEGEHIDDLSRVGESVFFADGFDIQFLQSAFTGRGSAHRDARAHELGVVFVGGDHQHVESGRLPLKGERADHVVGLKTLDFARDDAISFENVLDDGHRPLDSGRSFLTLGFIVGKGFVPEGTSRWIEGHCKKIGLFGAEEFLQSIDETKDRGGVFAF